MEEEYKNFPWEVKISFLGGDNARSSKASG